MKNVFMKMATSASAVAISAMLSMTPVFAASSGILVNDTPYDTAQTFDTWTWDGANDMTLTNFNGTYIGADCDLIITISGTNTITNDISDGIDVYGNLTINGNDGASLTVNSKYNGIYGENITINNATVEATGENYGIAAPNVTIKDSDVKVTATTEEESDYYEGSGIFVYGTYDSDKDDGTFTSGTITIENSNVEASGNKFAMVARAAGQWVGDDWVASDTEFGKIELINSTITTPEGGKVYVNTVKDSENYGDAYIVDAEGKVAKKVTIKKDETKTESKSESTPSHRAAVDTGLNTDISLYISAGLVALAGVEVLNSLKKKH